MQGFFGGNLNWSQHLASSSYRNWKRFFPVHFQAIRKVEEIWEETISWLRGLLCRQYIFFVCVWKAIFLLRQLSVTYNEQIHSFVFFFLLASFLFLFICVHITQAKQMLLICLLVSVAFHLLVLLRYIRQYYVYGSINSFHLYFSKQLKDRKVNWKREQK